MRRYYTFLFLIISFSLQAQFKQIEPNPDNQIDIKNISLPQKPAQNQGESTLPQMTSVDYETLAHHNIKSFTREPKVEVWNNGRPISITRGKGQGMGKKINDQATDFLIEIKDLLEISEVKNELRLISQIKDPLGMDHIRYYQEYKGIRVLETELILHSENDYVNFANGYTFPTPSLSSVTPSIDEEALKNIITEDIPMQTLTNAQKKFTGSQWEVELVIYHIGKDAAKERLAWFVEYRPTVIDRWFYTVDAVTGEVLQKYHGVCQFHGVHADHKCNHTHAAMPPTTATANDLFNNIQTINTFEESGTYYMIDASRPMYQPSGSVFSATGLIVTLDAQNTSPENNNFNYTDVASTDNTWMDRTTVSAHVNAGKSFEYFEDKFGRNSINGMGGDIVSLVHVADQNGSGMDNAFWNGVAMWYGDGNQAFKSLARGLDVAGHEISHGVVQSTANLTYQGESGALNESFADVFGAMIDRDDWTMGEDVVLLSAFPSGALRSLVDPHNGAAPGDYGSGFQPKHVNEQYTGNQDNGGVHINSGIPNHAFYLFAELVGKEKAEQVWYRALTNYLTASSQFIDLRIATIKATEDLYGSAEVNALRDAMDQVGILDGEGGNYQEDITINPGDDFILMTSINNDNLYIYDLEQMPVKISDKNPISKPSITDNGEEIVFIADDNMMHYIRLEWNGSTIVSATESVLQGQAIWRNVVISKDGQRLAGLFDNIGTEFENTLWVYDFSIDTFNEYELKNPTTSSEGNATDDVRYADAMEFDVTGEWIMYDAFNEITGSNGAKIEYWDISFIKVWNSVIDVWSIGDEVSKLFSSLPENVSVGNPTFSKNSPYIIAYEYIANGDFEMRGLNLETGDTGLLKSQGGIGYPSYSRTDEYIIYDNLSIATQPGLDVSNVSADKLSGDNHALLQENFRWGVWFGNGDRFTSVKEIEHLSDVKVFPNPTRDATTLSFTSQKSSRLLIEVYDGLGKKIYGNQIHVEKGENLIPLNLSKNIPEGQYYVKLYSDNKVGSLALQILK